MTKNLRTTTKTFKLAALTLVIAYDVTLEGPKSELCRRGKRDWGRKRLKQNKENWIVCSTFSISLSHWREKHLNKVAKGKKTNAWYKKMPTNMKYELKDEPLPATKISHSSFDLLDDYETYLV